MYIKYVNKVLDIYIIDYLLLVLCLKDYRVIKFIIFEGSFFRLLK